MKMLNQCFKRVLLIGFAFLLAPTAWGQSGKVAGRVLDAATGDPLPGVNVFLEGTTRGSATDLDGYYAILNIRPGTVVVVASFIGYAATRVEDVKIEIDKTTTIDFELREEAFEGEEIVVTAERPIVQVDRTTTTAFVDSEQLEALPTITIGEVINLQAGVVDGHFRGGRSSEVSYLVNGVPINNAFTNQAAFEVEQNMIAGLEVISGVFNAEHGQALSGIVNIVTKDIPTEWSTNFLGYVGGVASNRSLEFLERTTGPGAQLTASDFTSVTVPYYDLANFPSLSDVQFSGGGPIIPEKLGIQFSARYLKEDGTRFARRLFSPADSSIGLNTGSPQQTWIIDSTGDGKFVPLDSNKRYSLNGTLVYNLSKAVKVDYNVFYQNWTGNPFVQGRKYVPDGTNTNYSVSQTHILGVRVLVNDHSFANISYSLLHDDFDSYLYEDPTDLRHVGPEQGSLVGANAFQVGGNDLYQNHNITQTNTFVADYTNQVNRVHQVKTGLLARLHRLDNRGFGIERSFRTGFLPQISPDVFSDNSLKTNPKEFSAYIQDKMEYTNLIVNAGLRFDYFDPDYQIPVDWAQAQEEEIVDVNNTSQVISNRVKGEKKYQLSPRLGIAFPISAQGVMRFSAGLFFQIPPFNILYTNPEYEVNPQSSTNQFGNPDLEPERTLTFEVGFQQGLSEELGLEATVFSKDIRNLTGTEILRDPNGNFAIRWLNRDYGTVRGFTLSLFQRPKISPLSWTLDYTLQFANGSASDPGEAFGRFQSGLEPIARLQRLNWDRRHVLTNSITYAPNSRLAITFVNRLQSGTPYTTVRDFVRSFEKNNADKPTSFNSDMRLFYTPTFLTTRMQFFVQVQNLTDARPQYAVYEDTGLATESVQLELFRRTNTPVGGLNSLDEFFYQQGWFGSPRRVSLGLKVDL